MIINILLKIKFSTVRKFDEKKKKNYNSNKQPSNNKKTYLKYSIV